ncbi:hypothetical protein IV102_16960 [bacterium]|nr:hypothetical protein [bacterium]
MKLQISDLLEARVRTLAAAPLLERDFLLHEVSRHTRVIEIMAKKRPLPLPLAKALSWGLSELLQGQTEHTPEEHRRLIQAAVQYYVENDDDDHDLESPTGLDDDAEVFVAVAAALDRQDLVDEVAEHLS